MITATKEVTQCPVVKKESSIKSEVPDASADFEQELACQTKQDNSEVVKVKSAEISAAKVTADSPTPAQLTRPALKTDFDGDGRVGLSDLFSYLDAFFHAKPGADYNHDGHQDGTDVIQFAQAWAQEFSGL